jgi:hypothetical protein
MIKSIVKLGQWTIFGSLLGLIIPLLVGGARGLWSLSAKVQISQYLWQYFGDFLLSIPLTFVAGMFMASLFWRDWVLFAAIVGGLAAFSFLLLKNLFPSSSQKIFIVGIVLVIVAMACGCFYWQKELNIQAIHGRYAEFCTALGKNDYKAAYADMSPEYRQTISLYEFKQIPQKESNYGPSFSGICSYSISSKMDVTIQDNFGSISIGGLDFSDPWAAGTSLELKKVDGAWYFDREPFYYGLD